MFWPTSGQTNYFTIGLIAANSSGDSFFFSYSYSENIDKLNILKFFDNIRDIDAYNFFGTGIFQLYL